MRLRHRLNLQQIEREPAASMNEPRPNRLVRIIQINGFHPKPADDLILRQLCEIDGRSSESRHGDEREEDSDGCAHERDIVIGLSPLSGYTLPDCQSTDKNVCATPALAWSSVCASTAGCMWQQTLSSVSHQLSHAAASAQDGRIRVAQTLLSVLVRLGT